MFDIGFWELLLIAIIALVVLGPERLPTAIRSTAKFIAQAKRMVNSVKDELNNELRVQEMQEHLKQAENRPFEHLEQDVKSSLDELKRQAASVQEPYAKSSSQASTSDDSTSARKSE